MGRKESNQTNKAKFHPQTKFGIPTSNDVLYALELMLVLETRSDVKVTVTQRWYVTCYDPKIHPHKILNSYLK